MCTVSWFVDSDGYQLFFNRDERRSRPAATPPGSHERSGVRFIAPLDGEGGGTWLAVNERGLSIGLLNGYKDTDPPEGSAEGYASRGLLTVSLIDSRSAEEIASRLDRMELGLFRSFEVLALQTDAQALLARWNGRKLTIDGHANDVSPLISSSFDTRAVRQSRQSWYRRSVEGPPTGRIDRHLAYHRSHRPERGPYSPCMHRPDAKTLSFSHVTVAGGRIRFRYLPQSPCAGETDVTTIDLSLPLVRRGA